MDQRRAAILVGAALLLTACAAPFPSPSPTASPNPKPTATPAMSSDLLDCDEEGLEVSGLRYAFDLELGGATPDAALAAWMTSHHFRVPHAGYERVETRTGGAVYGYRVDGRIKVVVTFSSYNADLFDAPSTIVAPYTMQELALCDPSEVFEVGPAQRLWVNDQGMTLDDSVGPEHCMLQWARILSIADSSAGQFGFRHYVRDPVGVMQGWGTAFDTFAADTVLPKDAIDSGFRSGALELWWTQADTAAYIVGPTTIERWPRFENVGMCV
jgi:hypothetical protein